MTAARDIRLTPHPAGEVAPPRKSKLATLEDTVASIDPASVIHIGGIVHQARPVAAVRELIRQQIGELTVYSGPGAGYDIDLLIASGLVTTAFVPGVTFEMHGMAPSYRRAVEGGTLRAPAVDVLTLAGGYSASWLGLPFMPVAGWRGTDLPKHNPLAKELPPPYAGAYAVDPIVPDVSIIHAGESDEFGNVRSFSPMVSIDVLAAKAARRVVVVVDRLIDNSEIVREPLATTLAAHHVDVVCVVPYGAHPTSSPSRYGPDEAHIQLYHAAAESARRGDPGELERYFAKYIHGPSDSFDYLTQVGGMKRMAQLEREELIGPA